MESDEQDMLYDSDGDDGGIESDDDESKLQPNNKPYTVLKESDIRLRQEHEISHVSALLFVSSSAASLLLCHYNWDVTRLNDEWFADEEKVRSAVGLLISRTDLTDQSKESTCGICFDIDEIYPLVCGHSYCFACWRAYISNAINDGPGCLSLRCPDPSSCRAAVHRDMVDKLMSEEEKQKYSRFFLRSYVENARKKKTIKWCPAPGCDNAVEFSVDSCSAYDVTCLCLHAFCWNCSEDAHRPVDCDTVAKWVLKNSSEAENTEWILANSKPCPKCKRPIEKNHGCMHMTCTLPCSFQFCWLCLGDWSEHSSKTGGNYACNRYESERQKGLHDGEERKRKIAKSSLRRYTHYYERWASNKKSRLKAVEDLHKMQSTDLKRLGQKVKKDETELDFVVQGWKQIIECRQVLTWSYAYGYYLPEHEDAKRRFFEYLQGEAETALERLHRCAETELNDSFFGNNGEPQEGADLITFREKLVQLTKVTGTYFENLVRALENGLSEVDSKAVCNSVSDQFGDVRGLNDLDHWYCDRCTYANHETVTSCQMCLHPR